MNEASHPVVNEASQSVVPDDVSTQALNQEAEKDRPTIDTPADPQETSLLTAKDSIVKEPAEGEKETQQSEISAPLIGNVSPIKKGSQNYCQAN